MKEVNSKRLFNIFQRQQEQAKSAPAKKPAQPKPVNTMVLYKYIVKLLLVRI